MVYKAVDENEGMFAVKVMNGSSAEAIRSIEHEVKVLKMVKHPNIMPLLGFSKQRKEWDIE